MISALAVDCLLHRYFCARAYVIHSLLLYDWFAKQTASKPQTQQKGKLFGCEQPFLWREPCLTSQKPAAKETSFLATSC